MPRAEDVMFCVACAAVLGGFWGVVVGLVYPVAGACVGAGLFMLTFMILVNNCWLADEEDAKNLGGAPRSEETA